MRFKHRPSTTIPSVDKIQDEVIKRFGKETGTLIYQAFKNIYDDLRGLEKVEIVTALPTASVDYEGKIMILRAGAGVADVKYTCIKNDSDNYEWVEYLPPTGAEVSGPATNNDAYVPQWDGANSRLLKNGLPVGTGANNLLKLDANAKIPAVDGSQITGIVSVVAGTILLWGTTSAPSGYLICDGAAVSRTTYAALFAVIGTTFGTGDGSTTFNLPNLKGKVPVGYNSSETEFDAMGETGGEKTHQLTEAELASHYHKVTDYNGGTPGKNSSPGAGTLGGSSLASTLNTEAKGSDTAHNNLQPYITLNYIIKT